MASPSSTMRWSTRPESVINTSRSRAGVRATTSRCRTLDVDNVGYCTTATWRVSWASSRTARRSTSSRSTPDSRKDKIARRSEDGPLDERLRTDRLLGRHEVGDDGTQHLEATVVGATQLFTYPSQRVSAHFTCINRGNTARAVVRVADGPVVCDQSVSNNSDRWSAPPLSGVIWSGPLVRYERQFPRPSGWFHQRAWRAGRRRPVGRRWRLGPLFGGSGIEVMLFAPAGEV